MANCKKLAFAALLLFMAGCGDQEWGTLTGTVTLNGTPVGPGTLVLEPVAADQPGAMAPFGEDGKYAVMSSGRKEGAKTGEYRVRVHGGAEFGTEGEPPVETKIPARYSKLDNTELSVTIAPGANTHDFDLKP